jgi:hypothetical protein
MIERSPFHVGLASPDPYSTMALLQAVFPISFVPVPASPNPTRHYDPAGRLLPSPRAWHGGTAPLHVEVISGAQGSIYEPDRGPHLHHVAHWSDDVAGDVITLEHEGWQLETSSRDEDGRPARFAYLSRPGSTWIELVDSSRREWYLQTFSR